MIYDLKLDADGDLILGDQARDADETPLYYTRAMGTGERPQLTTDPEIGSVPVRPLQIVSGESSILQLVRARLMTENPDWLLYPKVGADLSDLIGKRNTPMTAEEGRSMIIRALTYDAAFSERELTVEAIPVSRETLLFDIKILRRGNVYRYALTLSLQLGITNFYEI